MKILIAYASKTGSTREMAALLGESMPNQEVVLADLGEQRPNPAEFDYIVLGAPIRFNRVHRAMRTYLAEHEACIAAMPHTLFLCCAFSDQLEHYFSVAFPRAVRESAEQCVYFGGDLSLSRQHGLAKWLTRMLRNSILESEEDGACLPCLLPEHVRLLAERLRKK